MRKYIKNGFRMIYNRVQMTRVKLRIQREKANIRASLAENPDLMRRIKENAKYKDMHKGKRCFILGNGPSLKEQDLSCLKGEILFTVNQFFRMDGAKELKPSYHFWADPFFFNNNGCMTDDMLRAMECAAESAITFFESTAYEYVTSHHMDKRIPCSFFKCGLALFDNSDISVDFSEWVSGAATVVQYAVEMAIYMGFSEIYLLGCDMTGILSVIQSKEKKAVEGTYSYQIDEKERKRIDALSACVSMESQFVGWGNMFAGYRFLRQYCEERGILLANATKGGVLDNLPRVRLEELFSN